MMFEMYNILFTITIARISVFLLLDLLESC